MQRVLQNLYFEAVTMVFFKELKCIPRICICGACVCLLPCLSFAFVYIYSPIASNRLPKLCCICTIAAKYCMISLSHCAQHAWSPLWQRPQTLPPALTMPLSGTLYIYMCVCYVCICAECMCMCIVYSV